MQPRETRSPIKNLPVRQPGQSIRERRERLVEDYFMPLALSGGLLVVVALLEWWAVWFGLPRMPLLYTLIALAVILAAVRRFHVVRAEVRNLRLGQIGEEAVGQYLDETLRPSGYHVLHDIPGDNFNIDHVVIGQNGVFSVETKTRSKPARGMSNIEYDGQSITVNGCSPDRDPVIQARAQANWLADIVAQSTGRRFPVRALVLFPGWFVEQRAPSAEVWVLNEKAAPAFITHARPTLSAEDVALIVFHLKRYVISAGRQS